MGIPLVSLPNGTKLPVLAYGTGTVWLKESEDDIDRKVVDASKEAIDLGYRHLDGAQYYQTESELGLAVEESGVPRSEFFLTTKAVSPKDIRNSLRNSLKKLRTDYVDLYLIHEPFSCGRDESVLQQAWKDMESCQEQGLARSIGVSNFPIHELEMILKVAKVRPVVNQIELHPYLQRPELRDYLKKENILVEVFAPLTPITRASPGPVDETCNRLARKHGVENSVILLKWVIDQGYPVITTSSRRSRLQQYLEQVTSFSLSEEEIEELNTAGKGKNYREFFVWGYGDDNFL